MISEMPIYAAHDIGKLIGEAKESDEKRNAFIQNYMPFVIKNVSDVIGKYVLVGDSDELSVGLMAFNEAIDRYDAAKGPFVSYARLVISSRLISYLNQSHMKINTEPLETLENVTVEPLEESSQVLSEEIEAWKAELSKFNITFQKLVIEKPKHRDTRERSYDIAEKASGNSGIVERMFAKYRLPIQLLHRHLNVSVKVIEGSKSFITSVMIIFVKELGALKRWIKKS